MLTTTPERHDFAEPRRGGQLDSGKDIIGHTNRRRSLHSEVQHFIPAGAFKVKARPGKRFGFDVIDEGRSVRHSRIPFVGPSKGRGNVRHKQGVVNADKGTALGNFSLARKAIRENTGRAA